MKAGDKVVVIDDVLTTGGTVMQAIEAVEALGDMVVRVVCISTGCRGASAGEVRLPPAVHHPRLRHHAGVMVGRAEDLSPEGGALTLLPLPSDTRSG